MDLKFQPRIPFSSLCVQTETTARPAQILNLCGPDRASEVAQEIKHLLFKTEDLPPKPPASHCSSLGLQAEGPGMGSFLGCLGSQHTAAPAGQPALRLSSAYVPRV